MDIVFSYICNVNEMNMTREELIEQCRYYKGEEGCPYEHENSDRGFFWNVESVYVQNAMYSDTWCEGWEAYVQKYIDDNPDEKNIYTSKDVSIHTKGIAVYIEEMSAKWCPNGPNKIFNY